jgi:hypothetical protein
MQLSRRFETCMQETRVPATLPVPPFDADPSEPASNKPSQTASGFSSHLLDLIGHF